MDDKQFEHMLETMDISQLKEKIDSSLQNFMFEQKDFLEQFDNVVQLTEQLKESGKKMGMQGLKLIGEAIQSFGEAAEQEKLSKEIEDKHGAKNAKIQKYASIGKGILGILSAGSGLYNIYKASKERKEWERKFKEMVEAINNQRKALVQTKLSHIEKIKEESLYNQNKIISYLKHLDKPMKMETKKDIQKMVNKRFDELIVLFFKNDYLQGGCLYYKYLLEKIDENLYFANLFAIQQWKELFENSPIKLLQLLEIEKKINNLQENKTFYQEGVSMLLISILRYDNFRNFLEWDKLFSTLKTNKNKEAKKYTKKVLIPLMELS